jgi:cobalt-zinc-cadmium efflux system outer membrane protein
MHRRWRSLCGTGCKAVAVLVFAVALARPSAFATEANLDADGVVRLALARNHDLQAARAQVEAALSRLRQAGLWPNPRLELSYDTDRPFANEGEYSRSAGFSQEFPISGRLGLAENVARVDVARALAEVNEAERKLIGDVTSAFYEIAAIDQSLKLRDELIASIANLAAASRNRFRAGEVSELDVNAATLELMRLKQDRTLLAGERAAAVRTLAGLVGLGGGDALAVSANAGARKAVPPADELIARAVERRPDLRLFDLAANRAEAEKALATASAWEDWNVSLGVTRDRLAIEGVSRQPADDALTMTLTIPIPLLNRNEGTRDAAAANKIVAQEQLVALRQRIENEVVGSREQLTQLAAAVDVYEKEALPLARKNTELAREAYRKGQISIGDVVQAERQEKDVATNYTDAFAKYFKGVVGLETATVAHADLMTHPVENGRPETKEQ